MKWTNQNKRAYVWIKFIQVFACLIIQSITILFYLKWTEEKSADEAMMRVIRMLIVIHSFDLATYLVDLLMVCKRWRAMIALRFIFSSISFSVFVIVQILFTETMHDDNHQLVFDFSSDMAKLVAASVIYVYQTFLIWIIINLFMYFQIVEMEIQEKKSQPKKLHAIKNVNKQL